MINDVLDNTINLFKANVKTAYTSLLFLLVLYAFTLQLWFHYFSTQELGFCAIVASLTMIGALETLLFLGTLNVIAGKKAFENINAKTIFYFLFAAGWIGTAAILGLSVLVLPGIFVVVTAILFSVLILHEDNGPLDAIMNSLELVRGNLINVTFLLGVVMAAAGGIGALLYGGAFLLGGSFINTAGFIATLLSFTVWCFIAAFMVSLHRHLSA